MKAIFGRVAAVVATGLLGTAPAAAVVVASYSGTVASGFDTDGLFGPTNTDLTGKAFVVDFTFDKNLGAVLSTTPGRAESVNNQVGGPTPLLGLVITIGGVPKTLSHLGTLAAFTTDAGSYFDLPYVNHFAGFNFNDGTRDLNGFVSFSGTGGGIAALLDQNVDPTMLTNFNGIFSYNAVFQFNFDTGLDDLIEGAYIILGDGSNNQSTTYTVTGGFSPQVDPVPEPASWAMLIAGFGLVGAAARRRRSAMVAG